MNILIRTATIISLWAAAVYVPSALALEEGTVEETANNKPKKVTDRRHPDYVRCRSEPIIGSLSRKRRICMTNAQWVAYKRKGSQDSKQFVEDSQPGFMATPN